MHAALLGFQGSPRLRVQSGERGCDSVGCPCCSHAVALTLKSFASQTSSLGVMVPVTLPAAISASSGKAKPAPVTPCYHAAYTSFDTNASAASEPDLRSQDTRSSPTLAQRPQLLEHRPHHAGAGMARAPPASHRAGTYLIIALLDFCSELRFIKFVRGNRTAFLSSSLYKTTAEFLQMSIFRFFTSGKYYFHQCLILP